MYLDELRNQINDIDDKIVELFVERMKVASEIAGAKAEKNLPVLDMRRENAVLQKIMEKAGEEFELYANTLYHTMFDVSKSYQAGILMQDTPLSKEIMASIETPLMEFPKKAVVACQGTEGSNAARACSRLFTMPNTMFFKSFEHVFNAVKNFMKS